jgi:hypothetical protein
VQIIGRVADGDPSGPALGWPGSRVIARFRGTAVSVRLDETPHLDGPSEWDVAVDGRWLPKIVLEPGPHTYDLARDLPEGPHQVELYKRSEGQNGTTRFLGYDFHGGTLLSPPPRLGRRLEIVGDSDVSGFGYEGARMNGACNGAPAWAARWENFRMAWGARLAEKLLAELHGTVFSGKGFYFNIWRPDKETFRFIYPRAEPNDPIARWDPSRWHPHVVVVSLGGNDYNLGLPEDEGPPPLSGVTEKAAELTDMIRAAHPDAHIFLMAYAVLTDADPPGRQRRTNIETALKSVVAQHAAKNDLRVYFTAPPQYDPDELTGCDGHGGPEYHERIARFMEQAIRARTGWN